MYRRSYFKKINYACDINVIIDSFIHKHKMQKPFKNVDMKTL